MNTAATEVQGNTTIAGMCYSSMHAPHMWLECGSCMTYCEQPTLMPIIIHDCPNCGGHDYNA